MRDSLILLVLAAPLAAQVRIEQREFHGWKDAVWMRNPAAVAVVVPSIGRIMQFGLFDEQGKLIEGPFFNNRALDGRPVNPQSKNWINFGGDKSWPAPQSAWPQVMGRDWPPPVAFDSAADQVQIANDSVTLSSPVDPHYGIRERRVITLDTAKPIMTIRTTYEKVAGNRVTVGVWVITQLNQPDDASASRPAHSPFAQGYVNLSGAAPYQLNVKASEVIAHRDPSHPTKIGTGGDTLLWIGKNALGRTVRMRIERLPHDDGPAPRFPDGGCHVEIYTNPDPLPYVEMETLGPLSEMKAGDRITGTNRYTLYQIRTVQKTGPQ